VVKEVASSKRAFTGPLTTNNMDRCEGTASVVDGRRSVEDGLEETGQKLLTTKRRYASALYTYTQPLCRECQTPSETQAEKTDRRQESNLVEFSLKM